jgi:hypothetical protein
MKEGGRARVRMVREDEARVRSRIVALDEREAILGDQAGTGGEARAVDGDGERVHAPRLQAAVEEVFRAGAVRESGVGTSTERGGVRRAAKAMAR